jgi:pyridoxal phosphate enzyme (YggS family)
VSAAPAGTGAVAAGLARVREEIAAAATRAGRDPASVRLLAVSKGFETGAIRQAVAAGQRDFGENRVQEALAKYKELGAGIRWHFIGRLQRNKAKYLLGWISCIHSVDRLELATEIDRRARVADPGLRAVEVLIEVNLSGEPAKGGVEPHALPALLEAVVPLTGIQVAGLMAMAPRLGRPEEARPYFRTLARLREESARAFPGLHLCHLSMGMSQDYPVAVEEGSTIVRVGEAIFGPRTGRARA